MKYFFYFLIFLIFVTCDQERDNKLKFYREEMENKVIACAEDSPKASEKIGEIINKYRGEGYKKILSEFKYKLPKEDRKILRECRIKVFGEFKKAHKGEL